METQTDTSPLQSFVPSLDRREHPRAHSDIRCVVKTKVAMHEYGVGNLSVSGALLTGGPALEIRCSLLVLLRVPLYPEVRIPARVVRAGTDEDGNPIVGIAFEHSTDETEDHIQSALLSELERSQTHGSIADVLRA
ncbi:MAG: PilZ domain-containing protein [Nannocystaceae bacterium]|nr:PilZ domain-containing protein [Nannocystaceae bacterium]